MGLRAHLVVFVENKGKIMDINKFKNKLIVFEGIDFTGKSTVAKMLTNYLNENNIETIFTFQPGDTQWGTEASFLRSLCVDKRHNLHELANFFAFQLDRVQQVDKVVIPALKSGKTVISDRWNYSTRVYQLYGKQLVEKYSMPKEVLLFLNDLASLETTPDYVYYFPETISIHDRIKNDNDAFDNESHAFKIRVHDEYEKMANENNFIRVPLLNSPQEVLNFILKTSS